MLKTNCSIMSERYSSRLAIRATRRWPVLAGAVNAHVVRYTADVMAREILQQCAGSRVGIGIATGCPWLPMLRVRS